MNFIADYLTLCSGTNENVHAIKAVVDLKIGNAGTGALVSDWTPSDVDTYDEAKKGYGPKGNITLSAAARVAGRFRYDQHRTI